MLNSKEGQAPTKNEQISLLQYHGSDIAFEEIDGNLMVNATQMAKPFGKRTRDWLKTQQAKDLLNALSKARKVVLPELQVVRNGGSNPGIWFHEDVALLFAQWLSPEFYLACNDKLKELIIRQALVLPKKHDVSPVINEGKAWYAYTEALEACGASKRGSAARRKNKHPEHFAKIYGRNFITAQYFDLMKGYYDWKFRSNQLKLSI